MSESDKQVGEILEQICIEWEIDNYLSSVPQKADTYVRSPVFHFANASWFLELWPNGSRDDNTVGWISLFLCVSGTITEEKLISFELEIKSLGKYPASHIYSNTSPVWGYVTLIKRDELLRKKNILILGGGTLTVTFRTRMESAVKGVASQTKYSDGINALTEDLRNLLIDEKNSDVIIKVKDRIFRVHKLILGSRSSVFSAMFEHDMKENTTGTVNIDDCEPEIFHDFLLFLYSGKVEKLSSDNVEGLYYLADKYILKDLTSICLNFMKENLDLNNVCRVVAIADRHHDEKLRKSASELIKRNLKTLIPSNQWITFMAENPVLAAEILMDVLPDNES